MMIVELLQGGVAVAPDSLTAAQHLGAVAMTGVIDPLAQQTPKVGINTEGVVKFLLSKIAPIFLGVLGLIFIARAGKGEVSKVVTSSAIAIVGLAFLGGALVLIFLGGYLVDLFFT
ncbi:MAG: hypothetical protein GEU94_12900 [Micromonosporaceae bacterium]|nr:hypothetical protein [Micromonosporaceae bacterium]